MATSTVPGCREESKRGCQRALTKDLSYTHDAGQGYRFWIPVVPMTAAVRQTAPVDPRTKNRDAGYLAVFQDVEDPRRYATRHDLGEMLAIALLSMPSGGRTCVAMSDDAHRRAVPAPFHEARARRA